MNLPFSSPTLRFMPTELRQPQRETKARHQKLARRGVRGGGAQCKDKQEEAALTAAAKLSRRDGDADSDAAVGPHRLFHPIQGKEKHRGNRWKCALSPVRGRKAPAKRDYGRGRPLSAAVRARPAV